MIVPLTGFFIDANLLVLLVIGAVDRALVGRHRRARRFAPEDYDRLRALAGDWRVCVTPNTLTEASNLVYDERDDRFLAARREIVLVGEETTVPSERAVRDPAFPRLGLTDAALLDVISPERPLLTVDLSLFATAARREPRAAINFTREPLF